MRTQIPYLVLFLAHSSAAFARYYEPDSGDGSALGFLIFGAAWWIVIRICRKAGASERTLERVVSVGSWLIAGVVFLIALQLNPIVALIMAGFTKWMMWALGMGVVGSTEPEK